MTRPLDTPDWTELLKAAAEGDGAAFNEICLRLLPTWLAILRARCKRFDVPSDQADDFLQEAILRVIPHLRQRRFVFPKPESVTALIIKTANYVLHDWLRRERRKTSLDDEHVPEAAASPELSLEMIDILDVFEKLPHDDREILTRVIVDGYTPAEAAPLLGIEEWAAYKRCERALKRVRSLLESTDHLPSATSVPKDST